MSQPSTLRPLIIRKRPVPPSLSLEVCGKRQNLAQVVDERPNSGCLTPTLTGTDTSSPPVPPPPPTRHYIGPYEIIGRVPDPPNSALIYVRHTRTKVIKTAQPLTGKQVVHVMQVANRLNEHEKFWMGPDGDELREAVLPRNIELIKDDRQQTFLIRSRDSGSLHAHIQRNVEKKLADRHNNSSSNHSIMMDDVCMLYVQIVRMVAFCHALGIVMRDLKLRKFVFSDAQRRNVRLCNIDDVVMFDDPDQDQIRERHGCPAYVSPEILNLSLAEFSGRAADIWSLGVLLYVMLTGRYPFYDSTAAGLFDKIRQCRYSLPPDCSFGGTTQNLMEIRLLIASMLRLSPEQRPTAVDLLASSAWLQSGLSANRQSAIQRADHWTIADPILATQSQTIVKNQKQKTDVDKNDHCVPDID